MAQPDSKPALGRWLSPHWLVASVGGLGHAPFAPGTVGSLPGVALYAVLYRFAGPLGVVGGLGAVLLLGFWSAGRVEREVGRKDPGVVVIDEVAGQLVALGLLAPTPLTLLAGFFLFRLFDVTKPPPARRLEGLGGASGIMLDDLVAGVWAAAGLHLVRAFFPGPFA